MVFHSPPSPTGYDGGFQIVFRKPLEDEENVNGVEGPIHIGRKRQKEKV